MQLGIVVPAHSLETVSVFCTKPGMREARHTCKNQ